MGGCNIEMKSAYAHQYQVDTRSQQADNNYIMTFSLVPAVDSWTVKFAYRLNNSREMYGRVLTVTVK